jgi:prepilin-type N-terminal cleavage/methylation domain-containing protein
MMRRRSHEDNGTMTLRLNGNWRGFSLVESLIAIAILCFACLGMLSVVPFAFTSVQTNSLQVQAISVAQQYLDDERNALLHAAPMPTGTTSPVDPGQSYVGTGTTNSNYGNFAISPDGCTAVPYAGTSASVYSCSATVGWTEGTASRTVTVQGYVTK